MSNIVETPGQEIKPEQPQALNFSEYRELCDEGASFRKVGILDEDGYSEALRNPSTVFYDCEDGKRAPMLVGLDLTSGYDPFRVRSMVGNNNVYLLAIPPETLTTPIDLSTDLDNATILVESSSQVTNSFKVDLPEKLRSLSHRWEVCDFIDTRIAETDHRTAWMGIYSTLAYPDQNSTNDDVGEYPDIKSAFRGIGGDLRSSDGFAVYDREDMLNNPDIVEKVWELFRDRFSWLGDNHPVSMEDSREMFESILMGESSFVTLRFSDGEPVCAGFFIHDIDKCDWISNGFLEKAKTMDHDENVLPMYFAGIAAKLDNAGKYAEGLIKFHCELAARAGIKYRVLFESSNMSSTYIPRIIEQYINESRWLKSTGIEQLEKVDYWYLTPSANN